VGEEQRPMPTYSTLGYSIRSFAIHM
jgi:hypothetical protein